VHPDELLEALRRDGAALAAALGHDLTADVPTCPGWTLETLANHCGRVHRWATAAVRTRATERPDFPPRPPVVDHQWFEEGVTELAAALEEAGPEAPCWNFMGQPPEARFWFRRQAHETSVHRWDVENARSNGAAPPIETELALDGIDELVDVIFPLGYGGGALGGTMHLHATDSPHGEWIITTIDGELLVGHDHQNADVTIEAGASDLLLWLWGRQQLDAGGFSVAGSVDVANTAREILKAP
jgi:uncharacterized protein (TIGR03083 family)